MQPSARLRASRARCAYCHELLGPWPVVCVECGTLLHPACRAELGGCPTLGCGSTLAAAEDTKGGPPRRSRRVRPGVLGLLLVGGLGVTVRVAQPALLRRRVAVCGRVFDRPVAAGVPAVHRLELPGAPQAEPAPTTHTDPFPGIVKSEPGMTLVGVE